MRQIQSNQSRSRQPSSGVSAGLDKSSADGILSPDQIEQRKEIVENYTVHDGNIFEVGMARADLTKDEIARVRERGRQAFLIQNQQRNAVLDLLVLPAAFAANFREITMPQAPTLDPSASHADQAQSIVGRLHAGLSSARPLLASLRSSQTGAGNVNV